MREAEAAGLIHGLSPRRQIFETQSGNEYLQLLQGLL